MYQLMVGEGDGVTEESLMAFLRNFHKKPNQIKLNDAISIMNYTSLNSLLSFKRLVTPKSNSGPTIKLKFDNTDKLVETQTKYITLF